MSKYLYILTVMSLCFVSAAAAQFAGKVTPSFIHAEQEFGLIRVSSQSEGLRMAVGAPRDGYYCPSCGAAYVFHYEEGKWEEKARFDPPAISRFFASALDISHNWLLVGQWSDHTTDLRAGGVYSYFYDGTTWNPRGTLNPSDIETEIRYGITLDMEGDLAVIGAYNGRNQNGSYTGAVYVFRLINGEWIEEAKIVPEHEEENDFGGLSVLTNGEQILISSRTVINDIPGWPAVYLYEHDGSGWVPTSLFYPEELNSSFGKSITMEGEWIAIGDDLGNGNVYLYQKQNGTWTEHSILTAPNDSTRFNQFGASVSIDEGKLLVGAPTWSEFGGASGGKVFEFAYDSVEDKWLPGSEWWEDTQGLYGASVYLEDEMVFIGAQAERTSEGGQGAIYVYGSPPVGVFADKEIRALDNTLSVFPNPVDQEGKVKFLAATSGSTLIELYDVLGRLRATVFDGYINAGNEIEAALPVNQLPAGNYMIRVSSGRTMTSQLFVKR